MLEELKSNPGCGVQAVQRVLHRWAGMGGTLGFPEISNQARRIEGLLTSKKLDYEEVEKGIESARRRFCVAARHEPKLGPDLVKGLMDVRIGLVDFSDDEANRIRSAANRSNVQAVIEQMNGESFEDQEGYGALIINQCAPSGNQCALSTEAALHRPQWSIPAVFIGSRASLESLSKLPSRAYDFLISPWEAEEVLMRVYRLIGKAAPSQTTGSSVHLQKRRPRVLIADDDPDLVALVLETLGQSGMDCEIARSGQQALETASRHPPDAIVLDVNMFDLDGFEVLKKLRHNLATKAIPVVLLTARNQESDIARGFGSGADDYVVKPFQPSDLARRVEKIITDSRKARVAR
jgi:CheY-like chemotaxis protein/HPt (histidine-containing phosphotransfer) domain-containing protein